MLEPLYNTYRQHIGQVRRSNTHLKFEVHNRTLKVKDESKIFEYEFKEFTDILMYEMKESLVVDVDCNDYILYSKGKFVNLDKYLEKLFNEVPTYVSFANDIVYVELKSCVRFVDLITLEMFPFELKREYNFSLAYTKIRDNEWKYKHSIILDKTGASLTDSEGVLLAQSTPIH